MRRRGTKVCAAAWAAGAADPALRQQGGQRAKPGPQPEPASWTHPDPDAGPTPRPPPPPPPRAAETRAHLAARAAAGEPVRRLERAPPVRQRHAALCVEVGRGHLRAARHRARRAHDQAVADERGGRVGDAAVVEERELRPQPDEGPQLLAAARRRAQVADLRAPRVVVQYRLQAAERQLCGALLLLLLLLLLGARRLRLRLALARAAAEALGGGLRLCRLGGGGGGLKVPEAALPLLAGGAAIVQQAQLEPLRQMGYEHGGGTS